MEKVALNNVQLDRLADSQPTLKPYFYGTRPCDRLPSSPDTQGPVAYIVNTDRQGQPGRHWLGLWTQDGVCEILDSYALPLETYQTTAPLQAWLHKHWDIVIPNSQSLQSIYSQSCGDYALFFLIDRSRGKSMKEFLNRFDKRDYVHNDHQVGQMLKNLIHRQNGWTTACACEQTTCGSRCGVRHLLL